MIREERTIAKNLEMAPTDMRGFVMGTDVKPTILVWGRGSRLTPSELSWDFQSKTDTASPGSFIAALPQRIPQEVGTLTFYTAIKLAGLPEERQSTLTLAARVPTHERTGTLHLSGLTFVGRHRVISPDVVVTDDGRMFWSESIRSEPRMVPEWLKMYGLTWRLRKWHADWQKNTITGAGSPNVAAD